MQIGRCPDIFTYENFDVDLLSGLGFGGGSILIVVDRK